MPHDGIPLLRVVRKSFPAHNILMDAKIAQPLIPEIVLEKAAV
jgi:hypothetical protein